MAEVIALDPVRVLVDDAVALLDEEDPGWQGGNREHKARMIDDVKRRTLRRVHRGTYYLFSMIVRKRILLCPAPIGAPVDLTYNPFRPAK